MPAEACRGCLATGSRLYNIYENNLNALFGDVVGTSISESDRLPQLICALCYAQLKKYGVFRKRCRLVQDILKGLELQGMKITTNLIKRIDRSKCNLHLNLQNFTPSNSDLFVQEDLPEDVSESRDNLKTDQIQTEKTKIEEKIVYESEISKKTNTVIEFEDQTVSKKQELKDTDSESDYEVEILEELSEYESERLEEDSEYEIEKLDDDFDYKPPTPLSEKKVDLLSNIVPYIVRPHNTITPILTEKSPIKTITKKIEKTTNKNEEQPKKYKYKFEEPEHIEEFKQKYKMDVVYLTKEQQIEEVREKIALSNRTVGLFCPDCGKGFYREERRQKHIKECHDESAGPVECEICRCRFTEKVLRRHLLLCHKLLISCNQCDYTSKSFQSAEHHARIHGLNESNCHNGCKFCDQTFTTRKLRNQHVWKSHTDKLLWCKCCGESFISHNGLNVHSKRVHPDYFTSKHVCDTCDIKFVSKDVLSKHLTQTCDGYICVMCSDSFESECLHKKHVILQHARHKYVDLANCAGCGVKFFGSEALERHVEEDTCGDGHPCQQCGEGFNSKDTLLDHTAEFHTKLYRACEQCDKAFDARNYRDHLAKVHSTKPSPERKALRPYTSRKVWSVHGSIIAGAAAEQQPTPEPSGKYICDVCGKIFKKLVPLKVHRRVHTGERPYQCQLCTKAYSRKESLKVHMLLHTGERPHKCSMCPKTFRRRNSLSKHLLYHSGVRRHICHICGKNFRTSTAVKVHIKSVHLHAKVRANRSRKRKAEQEDDLETYVDSEKNKVTVTHVNERQTKDGVTVTYVNERQTKDGVTVTYVNERQTKDGVTVTYVNGKKHISIADCGEVVTYVDGDRVEYVNRDTYVDEQATYVVEENVIYMNENEASNTKDTMLEYLDFNEVDSQEHQLVTEDNMAIKVVSQQSIKKQKADNVVNNNTNIQYYVESDIRQNNIVYSNNLKVIELPHRVIKTININPRRIRKKVTQK